MRRLALGAALVCAAMLMPSVASAQVGIAGSVRDATGAALPGVAVEAASPALIEKSRSVVTDGAGQYRLIDLSPGVYIVTFTLQGFKTVRRTDILLEGTLTAQVNADLEIGSLEESLTVTGTTPVVDVVNSRQSFVVNRDMLDAIPTARSLQARANLIPGTVITPGGSGQTSMTIHGSDSGDQVVMVDGMRLNLLEGSGQFSGIYLNDGMAQEITYDTGAMNAEVAQGGLRVNMIPREGGNRFSGIFFAQGVSGPLQADNRSDAVKPFITEDIGLDYTYEINPSFGGPIKRDRLWFYLTYKLNDTKSFVNAFFADGSQAFTKSWPNYSFVTRLTWQASGRDKLRVYVDKQQNGGRYSGIGSTTPPEASHLLWTPRGFTPQVKWTQTTTNRLLIEAGLTLYDQLFRRELQPTVGPLDLPTFERRTGMNSVAYGNPMDSWTMNWQSIASVSYVTGSHAVKVGMNHGWGRRLQTWPSPNAAEISQLRFLDGQPSEVTVRNTPIDESKEVMNADFGLFAQEAWTIDRLTLNVGGRYDYFNAEVPALSAPASLWVPAREIPAVDNVPNWHDWAIRLAAAYDLFGTGKTALKVNASKYVESEALGFASTFNTLSVTSQTRTWLDLDGNRSVLDANGNVQRNEILGGTANFGQPSGTARPDPNLKRGYNWEYGAAIQHEVLPRVSVTAGYHRRTFSNLAVTDNLNLSPSDWTPFTINAPLDQRLPGGGGYPIEMFTLNQAKIGTPTDSFRTFSTSNTRVYNGVDVSVNARLPRTTLLGGFTTERTASTSCDVRDNPNSFRFCDTVNPFRTAFKMSGSYALPYDFQVSGSFIARPASDIEANFTVTSAIAGRTIFGSTAGTRTIGVDLLPPNTLYLDYNRQLDLRLARTFRFGRLRAQGLIDVFNALNSGIVSSVNDTFGPNWLTPEAIQAGRFVRFGVQVNF